MSEIWGKMWGIVVWKPECAGRLASSGAVWNPTAPRPHVEMQSHYHKMQHKKDYIRCNVTKRYSFGNTIVTNVP